jgi:glycosyltransferase involved in cell wall biosynthesis
MKGLFLGYRGPSGQVARIEQGWTNIGEKLVKEDEAPDFIFANDHGFYQQAIDLKNRFSNAKLILNVLDIPKKYYPNFDLDKLRKELERADIITTISAFSQNQIKDFLGLDSKIIFNPIKDVSFKNYEKDIGFIYIGRLWENNKRFSLVLETLSLLRIRRDQFFIAGPDNPGHGLNYLGTVDDFTLDMLYNRSKFLICPTEYGVLGLPPIEAAICKCVPILCKDNPAAKEFGLEDFAFDPEPQKIAEGILNISKLNIKDKLDNISENLFNKLNKDKIALNIKGLLC